MLPTSSIRVPITVFSGRVFRKGRPQSPVPRLPLSPLHFGSLRSHLHAPCRLCTSWGAYRVYPVPSPYLVPSFHLDLNDTSSRTPPLTIQLSEVPTHLLGLSVLHEFSLTAERIASNTALLFICSPSPSGRSQEQEFTLYHTALYSQGREWHGSPPKLPTDSSSIPVFWSPWRGGTSSSFPQRGLAT